MPDFKIVTTEEMPYLYVERACSMDPGDISKAMGEAFGETWAFMEHHGVAPAGPSLSVYYDHDPQMMKFRAGFTIAREGMAAAQDDVMAAVTPAGRALHFSHHGNYAGLRDSYVQMMAFINAERLEMAPPTWELYMNDAATTPEDALLTECYTALA